MNQRNGKSRETIRTIRQHLQSTREGTVLVVGSEPFAARVREALDPHERERVSFAPREKDPDLVRELEGLRERYELARGLAEEGATVSAERPECRTCKHRGGQCGHPSAPANRRLTFSIRNGYGEAKHPDWCPLLPTSGTALQLLNDLRFPHLVRIEVSPALWRELTRYGSTVGATFDSPHGAMSLAALDSPPENYRVPLRWAADRGIPVVVDHNMPARPDPYLYRVVWSDGRTEDGSALAADGGA